MFSGKSILITGGTGSFGLKCAESLLTKFDVKRLVIYSRDELKQFEMQAKLAPLDNNQMRYFIGDVRDQDRLIEAMADIDYVIHGAALKQVPAAEYNPLECIKTNIHGAENVIAAALKNNVKKVVALSTDKAANPINLYGATKLASDKLFVAANNSAGNRTKFSVVRYGNVAGSRGSIIPLFRQLISGGAEYFPITHKDMTRFWIELQQGVDFVFRSFERMLGGELFVPKIPSFKVTDLAMAMDPHKELKIVGIRPGEKLNETMCPRDSSFETFQFHDHFVIAPSITFFSRPNDFSENLLGETGTLVAENYEYESGSNPIFLSVNDLVERLKTI